MCLHMPSMASSDPSKTTWHHFNFSETTLLSLGYTLELMVEPLKSAYSQPPQTPKGSTQSFTFCITASFLSLSAMQAASLSFYSVAFPMKIIRHTQCHPFYGSLFSSSW
ncbi:hypothetical protein GOP47_0028892 [Adiantum capillus-veneris]|nr:hypothetical protein GOP47_0028892 [Adiantum capillus-veneris]